MEYYKQPLIEMYNRLIMRLSEKKHEVDESFNSNKTNLYSLIENRQADIINFRSAIDEVQPFTSFREGFEKDFNKIMAMIDEVTIK